MFYRLMFQVLLILGVLVRFTVSIVHVENVLVGVNTHSCGFQEKLLAVCMEWMK